MIIWEKIESEKDLPKESGLCLIHDKSYSNGHNMGIKLAYWCKLRRVFVLEDGNTYGLNPTHWSELDIDNVDYD